LISYDVPIRFKTLPGKGISPKSIFYSSAESFLNLFLIDSTPTKLISYGTPIKFKTFSNREVLPELILYFSIGSFFVPLKYS